VGGAPATCRRVAALVAPMAHEPGLADALRSGFLAARRGAARAALERAQAREEVRPDVDIEVAVDLLAAPFYYRVLVTGIEVDDDFAADVVEAVVRFVSPAG
jgi:hypothetical protein